jgi:hypothetical protein
MLYSVQDYFHSYYSIYSGILSYYSSTPYSSTESAAEIETGTTHAPLTCMLIVRSTFLVVCLLRSNVTPPSIL